MSAVSFRFLVGNVTLSPPLLLLPLPAHHDRISGKGSVENGKIYRDLLDLIEKLQANQFETTPEIKAQFSSIMLEIAHYIDTK